MLENAVQYAILGAAFMLVYQLFFKPSLSGALLGGMATWIFFTATQYITYLYFWLAYMIVRLIETTGSNPIAERISLPLVRIYIKIHDLTVEYFDILLGIRVLSAIMIGLFVAFLVEKYLMKRTDFFIVRNDS